MKLLDTSVAIAAVDLLSGLIDAEESLLASEVVRFELLAGVRERRSKHWSSSSRRFLGSRSERRSHEPPPRSPGATAALTAPSTTPTLIAATALLLDAELLTTNVRHFPMIAGLEPAY